MTMDLKIIRV